MIKRHWIPVDGSIAILLAFLTAVLLIATLPSIGLTTDEAKYIPAGDSYASWIWMLVKSPSRALAPETITSFWTDTHEHPPVAKVWMGLIWLVTRHIFDPLSANRIGPILLVSFLIALLYLLVAKTVGRAAGLFSAAALLSMPRFFLHAHLAALDVPVAAASFAVIFLFWKTVDRRKWGWGILLGVVWGLAVATKLNGTFVPIGLVIWSLIFRRKLYIFLRFLLMGSVAFLTFIIIWPWLYDQTWSRLVEYIRFMVNHYMIGQWYLGRFYAIPPWHYVFVILWAVVPLTLLILFIVGIAGTRKSEKYAGLVWLLALNAFVSILPFLFGKILLYNGERLFMPVFPYLAALAGIGFGRLVGWLKGWAERHGKSGLTVPLSVSLALVLLAPQTVPMARLYPHLLSYYSEGVGGLPGATKFGLETTYWGEVDNAALSYINIHAEPGDFIWSEDSDVLRFYQSIGRLRQDVRFVDLNSGPAVQVQVATEKLKKANWFIFSYWQSEFGSGGEESYLPWTLLKNQVPVYEVSFEGVPLMKLYEELR